MKTPALILVLVVLLVSCARGLGTWTKPGVAEDAAKRDLYECTRDATYTYSGGAYTASWSVPRVNKALFAQCMEARGYQRQD